MNNKEKDIIWSQFLCFLMFFVATFCTGGLFLGAYIGYHIFKGAKRVDEYREGVKPIEKKTKVININDRENLTEEDKQYFYEHPYTYKIINYLGEVEYKNDTEDSDIDYKYKPINPRFSKGAFYNDWWNKPYWDGIVDGRKKYKEELIKKYEKKIYMEKDSVEFFRDIIKNPEKNKAGLSIEKYEKNIISCSKRAAEFERLIKKVNEEYDDCSYILEDGGIDEW